MNACNQEDEDYFNFLLLDLRTLLNRHSFNYHAHSVMLRQYGFNFITCSGVHSKNKINAFICPFDWITWTYVITTIAFIVAFTSPKNTVDSFIYTFGALSEQSISAFFHIFKKKWHGIPILLIFLTISGAYKGKILQFLLQPRQYELSVTKIKEMTNFTFYSPSETFFFSITLLAHSVTI